MKILVADLPTWSEVSTRPHGHTHLFRQFLSRGWQGCWVSAPHDLGRAIWRSRRRHSVYSREWRRGAHQNTDGVWAFTPYSLLPYVNVPVLRSSFVARNTYRFTAPSTRLSLSRIGFDRPDVLWVGHHRVSALIGRTKPLNIVYRMYDLATGFPNQPRNTEEIEAELCRRATVVFAVSEILAQRARQWSDRVVYLPNAVHLAPFDCPIGPEPDDLAAIPHPRVLYMGGLGDYVDVPVFSEIARARPWVHVVIVGEPSRSFEERFAPLSRLPNVHFLGARPSCRIPDYLRHSDAGLISDSTTELRHAASPLKLYEYAAAGLPVVASALHETQRIGSDALFYESHEECVHRIDEALANRTTLGVRMRAFAERNTWEMRYETIVSALREYGDLKSQRPV